MPTDKTIEIDLNDLTAESLGKLIKIKKEIADDLDKSGKRTKSGVKSKLTPFEKQDLKSKKRFEKLKKQLEFEIISKKGKNGLSEKIFGGKGVTNLLGIAKNPQGFLQIGITRLIPFIGAALVVTGVIANFIKKVDNFEKEFVNNVDKRIDLFRSKEQQVNIQAGLTQLIITSASGSAEPRDAYNTFQVFNTDQSRIEADFRLRDTAGVD